MAKVVIDANVIISAAFGGKPLEAVLRAFRDHEVYVSDFIDRELETVFLKLERKSPTKESPSSRKKFIASWLSPGVFPFRLKSPSHETLRTTIIFPFAKRRRSIF